jgi:hypothetical protein
MMGLSLASAASSFVGQSQAASAQASANNQTRTLALQNQNLQIRSLQNAEDEENRRATESLIDNSRAAEAAKSTALVSAGESGVSGLSIEALLGDLDRQAGENKQDVLQTQDFGQRQRQLDREGLGINTQSQINQLPIVEYPSFVEHAFAAGGSAYSSYNKGKTNTGVIKEF